MNADSFEITITSDQEELGFVASICELKKETMQSSLLIAHIKLLLSQLVIVTCIAGCGGGRKAGTIMTQGESACSRQQAETPTGC